MSIIYIGVTVKRKTNQDVTVNRGDGSAFATDD